MLDPFSQTSRVASREDVSRLRRRRGVVGGPSRRAYRDVHALLASGGFSLDAPGESSHEDNMTISRGQLVVFAACTAAGAVAAFPLRANATDYTRRMGAINCVIGAYTGAADYEPSGVAVTNDATASSTIQFTCPVMDDTTITHFNVNNGFVDVYNYFGSSTPTSATACVQNGNAGDMECGMTTTDSLAGFSSMFLDISPWKNEDYQYYYPMFGVLLYGQDALMGYGTQ
jgi:hypothetical protein